MLRCSFPGYHRRMTCNPVLDLWLTHEPAAPAPELLAFWASLLSADERQRWQRLARAEDRQRFLLVRALVRSVLGQELGVPPAALQFRTDGYGKPQVLAPGENLLQFNLSHTRGLTTLLLGRSVEVGVDVEALARPVELLALARRYFAAPEVQALEALAPSLQREFFFSLWTLKEAWVKAKGLGLRVPLDEFSFDGPGLLLPADTTCEGVQSLNTDTGAAVISMHCAPQLLEDPADWSFHLLRHGSFRIAVAAAWPATQQLRLQLHDAGPLLGLQ